jgi:hypothetical protein
LNRLPTTTEGTTMNDVERAVLKQLTAAVSEQSEAMAKTVPRVLHQGGELQAFRLLAEALIATHPEPEHLQRVWRFALQNETERGLAAELDGAEIAAAAHRGLLGLFSQAIDRAARAAQE